MSGLVGRWAWVNPDPGDPNVEILVKVIHVHGLRIACLYPSGKVYEHPLSDLLCVSMSMAEIHAFEHEKTEPSQGFRSHFTEKE